MFNLLLRIDFQVRAKIILNQACGLNYKVFIIIYVFRVVRKLLLSDVRFRDVHYDRNDCGVQANG